MEHVDSIKKLSEGVDHKGRPIFDYSITASTRQSIFTIAEKMEGVDGYIAQLSEPQQLSHLEEKWWVADLVVRPEDSEDNDFLFTRRIIIQSVKNDSLNT